MRRTTLLLLLSVFAGPVASAQEDAAQDRTSKRKRERLLDTYRHEAESYRIFRDSSRKEKAELQSDPVYVWTNPVRSGGQDGAVFVWTCRGRAEVVGTFYSDPATGPRKLNHEFHSLSLSTLDVERDGGSGWTPEGPGIDMIAIPDAPRPARTAAARLIQMRALSREFTAHTHDLKDKRWELRILAQPLYRHASTDPDILDGALFAFVTSAGTDPEALLVIEARRPAAGGDAAWHVGVARFTDLDLRVQLKGKEVYSASRIQWNSSRQDPKHRYRAFHVREIPAVEDEASNPNP